MRKAKMGGGMMMKRPGMKKGSTTTIKKIRHG
jgi:hypothetical protein